MGKQILSNYQYRLTFVDYLYTQFQILRSALSQKIADTLRVSVIWDA